MSLRTKIIGSLLIECRFSGGGYSLIFQDNDIIFKFDTNLDIFARSNDGLDLHSNFFDIFNHLIGFRLSNINEHSELFRAEIGFNNGFIVALVDEGASNDNAFILTNLVSGEWETSKR